MNPQALSGGVTLLASLLPCPSPLHYDQVQPPPLLRSHEAEDWLYSVSYERLQLLQSWDGFLALKRKASALEPQPLSVDAHPANDKLLSKGSDLPSIALAASLSSIPKIR